jgi:hypothetical protein
VKILNLLVNCVLLATTPLLLVYPQNHLSSIASDKACDYPQQNLQEWKQPTTYDEILEFLDELESYESDDLDKRYSPEDQERINVFLINLAEEGLLPGDKDEKLVLEKDIENLLYSKEIPFAYASSDGSDFELIPAIFNDSIVYDILPCGKISRSWKKTKKFIKDHKKEIIIGAVVVVAVTCVVVGVVAASAAGTAATASAVGTATSRSSESEKKVPQEGKPLAANSQETATSFISTNEAPVLKATIEEQISSFKALLVEDKIAQQSSPSKTLDDISFGEKAREFGAFFAHQAYDDVVEWGKIFPQFFEEVKDVGSKLVPKNLYISNELDSGSPLENYENLVEKGHQLIDKVFATDQAEFFSSEGCAHDLMNNFVIGIVYLPGSFCEIFPNSSKFKEAGKVLDRAGFTKAGRGLMKHGNREGSVFPRPLGNTSEMNKRGQAILEEILNDPYNKVYQLEDGSIKIYSSNGRGAFYKKDGTFRGFIEEQHE